VAFWVAWSRLALAIGWAWLEQLAPRLPARRCGEYGPSYEIQAPLTGHPAQRGRLGAWRVRRRVAALVAFIGFLTGFGFAPFGVLIAAVAKTIDNFNYVTSAVLTPLFLVAGTFFPVSALPAGVRTVAQFNPLYHCVQLVRDASLGSLQLADLGHAAVLLAFAVLMWRLAIWQLSKRLID
jgi:ABC-type uncharacterized transport system permease subunit